MKSASAKAKKDRGGKPAVKASSPAVKPAPRHSHLWPAIIGAFAAVCIVFLVYGRSMNGPFLLDDSGLAYRRPEFFDAPLTRWIFTLRPLLAFTYWVNFRLSGENTYSYHLVNVILHCLNGFLIYLALRKLLDWAGTKGWIRELTAIFGAGLFWLHPLQTESVSYIASRSETLSVFFFLAAFVVFLYRKSSSISILAAMGVLVCFGLAGLSKEHTVILPALLVLTDYYWNPGFSLKGAVRNWKLYAPIIVLGAAGAAYVFLVTLRSVSAGFNIQGLTWYQYFFTQCRMIWQYILLFVFPLGQNLDPDVHISRSIVDQGAIVALLGLLAVSVAAWIYRRRFPLASYGWFVLLALLAPTSSFIPIADAYAERRLYLPFIGLLLIAAEFVRRAKAKRATMIAALGAVLFCEGVLTYQRNGLWGDAVALWKATSEASPNKLRPAFQYAQALSEANRDGDAIREFAHAATIEKRFDVLLDWGLSYDRMGDHKNALIKLREAAAVEGSPIVYTQIAKVYSEQENYGDALEALRMAEGPLNALRDAGALRPDDALVYATVYQYRGSIYIMQKNYDEARQQFRSALQLNPRDEYSRRKLAELGG